MTYDTVEIEDMEWCEELRAFTYQCPCGDLFQITLVRSAASRPRAVAAIVLEHGDTLFYVPGLFYYVYLTSFIPPVVVGVWGHHARCAEMCWRNNCALLFSCHT
jgi:hypothetical protein